MYPPLHVFRRQYLQCFEPEFLAWPSGDLLKEGEVQSWMYDNLFNGDRVARLPPERYQFRVLKLLMAKIEKSIVDPEQDEISDELMSHLSALISSELPSESTAAQQKTYVTFTCLPQTAATSESDPNQEPTILLLERRYLISGSLTTGFRTWEAALHLGSYLLNTDRRALIEGKNVLELGAGTGFLSILCAKILQANHVTSTDGDEGVVEALKENAFLNNVDDDSKWQASILRWGRALKGTWVEDEFDNFPYDTVVGADITYDKIAISALVATLRSLFEMKPSLQVLISGAVRNWDTFNSFVNACERNNFVLSEVNYEPQLMRQQSTLFYATVCPLKILHIRAPA